MIIRIPLWNYLCILHSFSILASKHVFFLPLNTFSNGDNIQIHRTEPIVMVAGNLHREAGFDTHPPYWQLLRTQLHIIRQRVQKGTSPVISLVYIFCIEIVDFFSWDLLEMIKDICRVLKYRWKNFKFAHFGIILKQKCYCWIWACDGWMSVSMKWHKSV